MSKTEAISRAGEDLSPVAEVKSAVAGFVSDFKGFQSEMQQRLQQQEDKMTKLERKSAGAARPVLSASAETQAPHQKAFDAYLRSGDDDALRGLELEGKAMSTAVAGDGGYLVDPQTADQIKSVLSSTASIRAIANVVQVEATSFDVLIDHSDVGHGWATEAAAVTETGTPLLRTVPASRNRADCDTSRVPATLSI